MTEFWKVWFFFSQLHHFMTTLFTLKRTLIFNMKVAMNLANKWKSGPDFHPSIPNNLNMLWLSGIVKTVKVANIVLVKQLISKLLSISATAVGLSTFWWFQSQSVWLLLCLLTSRRTEFAQSASLFLCLSTLGWSQCLSSRTEIYDTPIKKNFRLIF